MKFWFCLLLFCYGSLSLRGQDTIMRINKTILVGKIIEVSNRNISIREAGNPDTVVTVVPHDEVRHLRFLNGTKENYSFTHEQEEKQKIIYFRGSYFINERPVEGRALNRLLFSQHEPGVTDLVKDSKSYFYTSLAMAVHGFHLASLMALYGITNPSGFEKIKEPEKLYGYIIFAEIGSLFVLATGHSKLKQAVTRFNKNFIL